MMRATPIAILIMCGMRAHAAEPRDYPVTPVPFTAVHFTDDFWARRLEANRAVTVPYDFKKCEETGRIDNFLRAAHKKPGKYQGYAFDDSDVFKVVEGAAYSLSLHPDADLDRYLDDLIAKFAAAQEPDGYLYAARTTDPNNVQAMCGKTRYSNLRSSHELYNIGHMYEAAAAHFAATGKRNFLDIAIKSADHVDREFGPGKRVDPPGHEEIEIGLVKLYRATGDERYLKLAKFFLDCRGRNLDQRPPYGDYAQDHVPVTEHDHAVGHSVRAGYLYSGMADVAALTGDEAYIRAIDKIWENMAGKRLYITGGIGARSGGGAFGDDYELPNRAAYAETCAAIANALWNQRMFLLHGDAKYIDVLERVLYNGFLSGVSLEGDRFFYVNPLASDGKPQRQEWFDCSCCPTNVVRFIPSIPGYVYAQRGDALYVNLFIAGNAKVKLCEQTIEIVQETKYPWDGNIRIQVKPEKPVTFTLYVRVPGWATGKPVPSDLYSHLSGEWRFNVRSTDLVVRNQVPGDVSFKINGADSELELDKGYAKLRRTWQSGDMVELSLGMPVRRVIAHPQVREDDGRVALERGPILYCVEAVDNGGKVSDLFLPGDAPLTTRVEPKLLGGMTVVHGTARRVDGNGRASLVDLVAVPYYAWCHRTPGEMAIWLAQTREALDKPPLPASASHVFETDTVAALSDGRVPKNSGDQSIPRFTWWNHQGTAEWVQYDFAQPRKLHQAEVYWFDDTGVGRCRVPASWRLLYKAGDEWKPVQTKDPFGTAKDQFNGVAFEPLESAGLRIEVMLQEGFSGGILEWKIE